MGTIKYSSSYKTKGGREVMKTCEEVLRALKFIDAAHIRGNGKLSRRRKGGKGWDCKGVTCKKKNTGTAALSNPV